MSDQDTDSLVEENPVEAVGGYDGDEVTSKPTEQEAQDHDPLYVQKRLKQQKRAHDREMRELRAQMDNMQSQGGQMQPNQNDSSMNPYGDDQQNQGMQQQNMQQNQGMQGGGVDEQIHKAVSYALQHKDMQERQAQQAHSQAHLARKYQDLQKHLDNISDEYDDFEDVVRGPDTPITPAMRDAALMLPKSGNGSAGKVLYKLGKNRDELARIAKLHPVDQAEEMMKLSHALISGGESKGSAPRMMGSVKNNPISNSSAGVTEKTPVSEIRARMRDRSFK